MDEDNNPFAENGVWGGSHWGNGSTTFDGLNSVYGYTGPAEPPAISNSVTGEEQSVPSLPAATTATTAPFINYHQEGEENEEQEGDKEPPHSSVLYAESQTTAVDPEHSEEDSDMEDIDVMGSRYEPSSMKSSSLLQQSQQGTAMGGRTRPATEFIAIVDYGTIRDHGQSAVAYTVQYNNTQVMRRYSDFDSLRSALVRLFPTLIIPPIPEKHSVVKYLVNPLNAKNDLQIIEKRTRMLTVFLQRCLEFPQIQEHFVWRKFLDPSADWNEVLRTPPISIIPLSNLLAPPLDPTKPSPLHSLLPTPHSSSINNFKPREEDKAVDRQFRDYEQIFKLYKSQTQALEKGVKRQKRHFKGLVKDLGELGAYYNAFSLEDTYNLSLGIEKTGQAIDVNFINSEAFAFKILTTLQEPTTDICRTSGMALGVLHFRKLKEVQLFIIETTIKRRKHRIEVLVAAQDQVERLSEVLRRNAKQSPTIADALRRLDEGDTVQKVSSPWARLFNTRSGNAGNSSGVDDITLMNENERAQEISKLEHEVEKLEDCHNVILKDIEQVNKAIKDNCDELIQHFQIKWKEVLQNYTESLLIWLKENLKAWEDAKAEVEAMDIPTVALDS